MTQPSFPNLTPLAAGERVGEFRILSLIGQESISGYAVQHYEVAAEAAANTNADQAPTEPLYLRRIVPPPPSARTEAEWLAALQTKPAAERASFTPALAAWSDAQASYLVRRRRVGQSLQTYLTSHPPLPPEDGELLARGLLGAAAGLHAAGLHIPHLSTAQVWLGSSGEVGLCDLWAALGEPTPAGSAHTAQTAGSVGGDLQRIGAVLREAVGHLPPETPLGTLLAALNPTAATTSLTPLRPLPISANAALRLLDSPLPTEPAPLPEPPLAPEPQAQPAQPMPQPTPSSTPQPPLPPNEPRPLWPLLLPVAALLLAGIVYLAWPQLMGGRSSSTSTSQSTSAANTSAGTGQGTEASAAAAESPPTQLPTRTTQVMTLPATLNLRPSADTSGAPLAELPVHSIVTVLSQKGDWYKVRSGEQTGWINAGYTLPVLPATEVEALRKAAQSGGHISLAKGVYLLDTPLTLQWDTELVGQGREQTYLVGTGGESVLLSRDVRLNLERLAVIWNGRTAGQPVQVERGSLRANDIWITGGRPDGTVRMRGSGLWLRAGASAAITDSLFSRNAIGLSAEDSALTLSGSTVKNNRFAGLIFSGAASGQVQNNVLENNTEDGVLITGRASPTLSGNQIRGSLGSGVDISEAATPTLSGNQIEGGKVSLSVSGQATPTLSGNVLQGATEMGLGYAEQAAGTAEGNTISKVAAGIVLTETAAPTLRANQILGVRGEGLSYSAQSGGQATENAIEGSGGFGITVSGEATPTLEGNRVLRGAQSGLLVQGRSRPTLRRNTVQGQAQHGIVIKGDAQAVLEQNAVLDSGGYGLVFKELGRASAERNLCQNNRAGPALLQLSSVSAGPSFGRDGCLDGIIWPPPTPVLPQSSEATTEPITEPTAPLSEPMPTENAPAEEAPTEPTPPEPMPTEVPEGSPTTVPTDSAEETVPLD